MENGLKEQLSQAQPAYITEADKTFILLWDERLKALGYTCGGEVRGGFCWGKYMLVYTKAGVKSDKSYCRVYLRDIGAAVRLYLNGVDDHRAYLEGTPDYILDAFTNDYGACKHCPNKQGDACRHRKSYTLFGKLYEKCDGFTFELWHPSPERVDGYAALLTEFYPVNGRSKKTRRV